jgi:putative ABC transport system ATP-binding protein
MVTHEADVARHAKRIIRMRDGRVLSDLPTEQDVERYAATGGTAPAAAPASVPAPVPLAAAGVGA